MVAIFENIKVRLLSVSEIIKISWRVFEENFLSILAIMLIVYIPISIVVFIFDLKYNDSSIHTIISSANIGILLSGFVGILADMAINQITYNCILSFKLSAKQALYRSFIMWGGGYYVIVLKGLIILASTLLFVIPGILMLIYYIFAINVLSIKYIRGKAALNYSRNLVKGNWLRVFGHSTIFLLIFFIICTVFSVIFGFVLGFAGFTGSVLDSVYVDFIINIITNLFYMFFSILMAVLFINLDYVKNQNDTVVVKLEDNIEE